MTSRQTRGEEMIESGGAEQETITHVFIGQLTKRAFWRQVITSSGRAPEVVDDTGINGARSDTMVEDGQIMQMRIVGPSNLGLTPRNTRL